MKKPNYNNKRVLKKTLTAKMLICDTFVGRKNAVIGPLVFNPLFSTSDLNHLWSIMEDGRGCRSSSDVSWRLDPEFGHDTDVAVYSGSVV